MASGLWYVTLFSLGTGVALIAFWIVVVARGRLASLLGGQPGARGHVVAEFITGALLLAGGVALLVAGDSAAATGVVGLGLGALVYALSGSPGMYPGNRPMRAVFVAGWLFTIPAIALFLLNL